MAWRTAARRIAVLRMAAWAVAIAASAGVFALYTRPDFLLTLATQVWTCF